MGQAGQLLKKDPMETHMSTNTLHLSHLQQEIRDFGYANTLKDLTLKVINKITYYKILHGMSISRVNPKYYEADPKYTCKFLSLEELLAFAPRKEFELGEEYVRGAIAKGDRCYAILDNDILASYGWYANTSTPITSNLTLQFNPGYIYMYKGFTNPDYRGQRLHAIGMTRALDEHLKMGYKGLVSYVEDTNYRSLHSVYRMGYEDFGKVHILKLGGRYLIHRSAGCEPFDFNVTAS